MCLGGDRVSIEGDSSEVYVVATLERQAIPVEFDASTATVAPAVSVRGLRKAYGSFEAVRGIDFEVAVGEIFAFVGPNGAGKTTTVEILEGYRSRNAGEVSVLGADPVEPTRAWRSRIGVVLQSCQLPPQLTVGELVARYASYYPAPRPVEETIALVGLEDKRDAHSGRLSGGQQRRLDVALALVGDPELIFLDEPTTGFDPGARHQFWDVISGLRSLGKTIFLTTHYMDEAQALADRVAVIAAGQIVAEGPPDQLGGRDHAACEIHFRLPEPFRPGDLPVDQQQLVVEDDRVEIHTETPQASLSALLAWADVEDAELRGLEVVRPSLEDIYLKLVSKQ
jgi:ABC-2 type transport system ATP-binding protein